MRALALAAFLLITAGAALTFRYQVLDNPDGGVRSRYDRWTGQLEYAAPDAADPFTIRWARATDLMREERAKRGNERAWNGLEEWPARPPQR